MSIEYPVNRIPPVVLGLAAAILVIEAILSLAGYGIIGGQLGVGWRSNAIQDWAFSPAVLDRVVTYHDFSLEMLKRFLSYSFVHVNFTHALFVAVLLLAIGKFVGDVFSGLAVLVVYVGAAIFGALVYGLVAQGRYPLVGGYPPVYGLIGAFTYLLWLRLGQTGGNQYRAFTLIGFLLAVRLIFTFAYNAVAGAGLLGGAAGVSPEVFYGLADVSGFVAGLALSVLVAPGGWSAFLRRLRQRT
ncbi:MAG: rhomboid family intramembrane serine protease [Limimaricola sp.]|uniref:rhomboid family intramembrane serine protease n=1 Tax=Limimaricola sp. TaxID=2211665 RepID=UPI001D41905D|nr:rhomboid family intramembrane serine protease [Limimaricola sp.]MBI1417726.1 rhomboid family intramembrane serine protease [Limimaricola sp.]